ncbi:terminase large subunit [Oceanidesulfovibrio indonesiensis]|uniref:Terminase large subunit n=1 Tax=Oceanidesulfovibrio indonesiensis TaxID=54767 RepID=A0A7M3MEM0_9BACT|nr:terminase TerL endonuclease subunit [Oceanidesulfovibrio indonesiensis]TVM16688.1 terminase large subunit [Oceanidesulfovibrio indonesiensis]
MNRADEVIRFASLLRITSGRCAGQQMRVLPHIEAALRGTLAPGVRTSCISWPRKQSKSTGFAAVLILAHLVGPLAVPRGQMATASASRDQAALIYDEVAAFLRAEPELHALVNISDSRKTITATNTGSTFRALSADAHTAHGLGLDVFVMDEGAQQRDSELWDVLFTSQSARANPLAVMIGTRSQDPQHFFSQMIDYGEKVMDGTFDPDPSFFCHVLAANEDADWQDESVWRACNPCLDAGVQEIDSLRELARQAAHIPSKENVFRALHLNQAVGQEDRFISSIDWRACAAEIDPESLRGRPCYGGLDLASTRDLNALALFFPEDGGRVLTWFWCPDEALDAKEHRDRVPYRTWAGQGYIEPTPGRGRDSWHIAQRVVQVADMFDLRGLAIDRWRADDVRKLLEDSGADVPIVPFGQGYASMSPAVDAFEARLLDGKIRHPDNPVLTWCAANATIQTDPAGNRKVIKPSDYRRVDGIISLIMACGLAAREPEPVTYDFSSSILLTA